MRTLHEVWTAITGATPLQWSIVIVIIVALAYIVSGDD